MAQLVMFGVVRLVAVDLVFVEVWKQLGCACAGAGVLTHFAGWSLRGHVC